MLFVANLSRAGDNMGVRIIRFVTLLTSVDTTTLLKTILRDNTGSEIELLGLVSELAMTEIFLAAQEIRGGLERLRQVLQPTPFDKCSYSIASLLFPANGISGPPYVPLMDH